MTKKMRIIITPICFAICGILLGSIVLIGGCGTGLDEPAAQLLFSISGTVSWVPSANEILVVSAYTASMFTSSNYVQQSSYTILSGQASKTYTLSGLPAGTYYVSAVFAPAGYTGSGTLLRNSQVGQYSDGKYNTDTAGFQEVKKGSPEAVVIATTTREGINFFLDVVY